MSNQGNGGIRGKFQERLRNIRISKSKKKKFQKENEQFIHEKVKEIRETIKREPKNIRVTRVTKKVADVREEPKKQDPIVSKVIVDIRKTSIDRKYKVKRVGIESHKKQEQSYEKKEKSFEKEENVSLDASKKQNIYQNDSSFQEKKDDVGLKTTYHFGTKKRGNAISLEDKKEELRELGTQIIEKIKNSFLDKLDELEVLESELYFITQDQENELELKKVKELKKKINDLVEKVNQIIEQYNLYCRNYYIDNIVGIDDNQLVEDMIDYRTLLDSSSDEKKFVREYKLLDEFHHLYGNLKSVREETISLIEKNDQKINQFQIRDKKYYDIQLGVVHVQDVMKKCDEEILKQNEYFDNLMGKIQKIDKEQYTTYHLRGMNELLGQSLRYMGLMMLSPFQGLLPNLAIQTIATRRLIGNIYQHMHFEEVQHVRYQAINYDSELSHKLTDIDYTSIMIDDTLKDIEKLKEDFLLQYDSKIPGYEDTLKKIDKVCEQVIRSQNKICIIRNNLKHSKKLNENKMSLVRKMNQE